MREADNCAVREAYHRCRNDLQLVVSMLQLSARRSPDERTRQTLDEIGNRVCVLAQARSALMRPDRKELATVLREVREALQAVAEPNGVVIALSVAGRPGPLSPDAITAAALAVNELVTNSLKHAFKGQLSGHVAIRVQHGRDGGVIIKVDDDGLPFPDGGNGSNGARKPLGLELAHRMLAAQDGTLMPPRPGSKCFEIRLPAGVRAEAA